MAATSQLPKIADLIGRIGGLSAKQRGMRIEAEDWNTLVDVLRKVLEIDRAQEESAQSSLEQRFAPRDHEHLGQTSVAWLDPSLQTTIGKGVGTSTRVVIAE